MGQLGAISPEGSVAIGIVVGLLSTGVQSLGLTLQRKSHILEDERDELQDAKRPPYRRRRWQLGMGMFVLANLLGSTIQITTLPLPVLSTLQASGLVFNSICATLLLGEPFTTWSFGGTALVCTGAVLIAVFGAIPEPAHTLDQLLQLLERRPFILWMSGQAVLVVIIIIIATCLTRFPEIASNPQIRLLRGLSYGCVSGILSAHSLLVAKSAVELLVRTIVDGSNQFNRWQSWIILLSLVMLALTQLYYLHQGLKLVSTSVLYPLVFCIYNIIAILDGLIYFRQTDQLSLFHGLLIALGTAILLSGVLALSWRLNDEQTPAPVAQSALAPGLGFVEDTDLEDESGTPDEDSEVAKAHRRLMANEPMTPTTKLDTVLGATRNARRSVRMSLPSRTDSIGNASNDHPDFAAYKSAQHPQLDIDLEGRQSDADEPDEETALLPRSASFHRRKRRKSTGFPGFTARPSPRASRRRSAGGGLEGTRGGGFGDLFRLRWWRSGDAEEGGRAASPTPAIASWNRNTGSRAGAGWLGGQNADRDEEGAS